MNPGVVLIAEKPGNNSVVMEATGGRGRCFRPYALLVAKIPRRLSSPEKGGRSIVRIALSVRDGSD